MGVYRVIMGDNKHGKAPPGFLLSVVVCYNEPPH